MQGPQEVDRQPAVSGVFRWKHSEPDTRDRGTGLSKLEGHTAVTSGRAGSDSAEQTVERGM